MGKYGLRKIEHLYHIAHKKNVESILRKGLLSHARAKAARPVKIANPEVNTSRSEISFESSDGFTNCRRLHSYANLYFNPRNAMMYWNLQNCDNIVMLRFARGVFHMKNILITDRNAVCNNVNVYHSLEEASEFLSRAEIFLDSWNHENPETMALYKSKMMAEVLIPDRVPAGLISGIIVNRKKSKTWLENNIQASNLSRLEIVIDPDKFFDQLPYLDSTRKCNSLWS